MSAVFALAARSITASALEQHGRFQRDLSFYIWRWPLQDELQRVMRSVLGMPA